MTETDDIRWVENPVMGQRVRILTLPVETGGRNFVLEYVNRPFAGRYAVPEHFHPVWSETFEILSGRGRYLLGGKEEIAAAGDRIVMPPNVPHVHPWSDSDEELRVRQAAEADPPDAEGLTASLQAVSTLFGLAREGKVNKKGLPNILQTAVIASSTMPGSYLAGPPAAVQDVLIRGLAAIGRLVGYRTSYPRFGSLR